MLTLVIFDIDGTLLSSNSIDSYCFASTYEDIYKKEFPTIDWTKYPHVTDTVIFDALLKEHFNRPAEAEEVHTFQAQYVDLLQQKRKINPTDFMEIPGARDTFHRLLEDDAYLPGIATGGWKLPAEVKLKHVGIRYLGLPQTYADDKWSREAILGDTVEQAKNKHDNIDRVVYIGDAIWDVNTTRNMNMDFVGIRRKGDLETLQKEGANRVLKDFTDYPAFLKAISSAKPPN